MANEVIDADPDKILGPVVTKGKDFVVRVKDNEKETSVYIHRVGPDGKEQFPRGYYLGENAAVLSK